MTRRSNLAGAWAAAATAVFCQPLVSGLNAQEMQRASAVQSQSQSQASGPGDHRFRYMGAGAAIGGLLALGYHQLSVGGRAGRCQPMSCALPYLTMTGALSGLFISREKFAERRAEMPRAGSVLEFRFTETVLPAAATALGIRDTLVVAATDSGAQVLSTARGSLLRRRGAGLSNLRSVAIAGSDPRLLIGTGTALWETPLTTGLISRVLDGPVDALSAHGDIVVATSGNSVRVRRMAPSGATRIDSLNAGVPVTSARFDATSGKWWLTGDSLLFELTVAEGDALPVLTQRAMFSGQARAVASSRNWVAVALGSDGLAIWPRTALGGSGVTSPVLLRGEPRFAFDLAFVGDDLFVAGGVDGVTRVDLSAGARIVGSSKQGGYATTIESDNGVLWVGDRNTRRLLKITP